MNRTIVTSVGHPNIDVAAGTIDNLALIAEGEIKWGQGWVDAASLQTYLSAAGVYGEYGVPIMFNPEGFDHGPGGMAGNLRDLRIGKTDDDVNAVLGKFYAVPEYPDRNYLFSAVSSNPVALGLSVETMEYSQKVAGRECTRCSELMCAKFVLTPAATRGLFQAGTRKVIDVGAKGVQSPYLTLVRKQPTRYLLKK